MTIATFDELKEAVANQFVTSEVVVHVPVAIKMVEANINRNVRVRRMMQRSTAALDGRFIALPSDFLAMSGIQVNTDPVTKLEFRTSESLDAMKSSYFGTGKPLFYTVIAPELEVLPAPDSDEYEVELTYYQRLTALSDAATTNWLLTYYPDIYFHGTLAMSGPYVNDRRTSLWAGMYDAALEELIVEDERARFPLGGGLRMRPRNVYS